MSSKGQSRCFIADSPATLALQKQVGELLVDLHGQHEHQSLLRLETHIAMLDDFGGLEGIVAEFQAARRKLREIAAELDDLRKRERQLAEKREFYEFQIAEIDALGPRSGEEEELQRELKILENSEKLFAITGTLYGMLYDGEQSVHDLLVIVRNQLQDIAGIDTQFAEAAKECASAEAVVSELAKFIQGYNARVEFNPERLDALRDRLGKLALLKRKYGGSVESMLAHREKIGEEVLLAENFNEVIARLTRDLEEARTACAAAAARLSAKRHDTAKKVDGAVGEELAKLGVQHARFTTRIRPDGAPRGRGGSGRLRRCGEEKAPAQRPGVRRRRVLHLHESRRRRNAPRQGRLRRRGLPHHACAQEHTRQIGPAPRPHLRRNRRRRERPGGAVGRQEPEGSVELPPGHRHHPPSADRRACRRAFAVEKKERGSRTTTGMRRLTLDEQVHEVARLLSGAEVTDAGILGARELMGLTRSP